MNRSLEIIRLVLLAAAQDDRGALRMEFRGKEDELTAGIAELKRDEKALPDLAKSLPAVLKLPPAGVYKLFNNVQLLLGPTSASKELIGLLWMHFIESSESEDKEALLMQLTEVENFAFWTAVQSMPLVFASVKLPAPFFADLLRKIGERVAGDMAGGDFYRAVEEFGLHQAERSMAVARVFAKSEDDDLAISLLAILLGTAKVAAKNNPAVFEESQKLVAELEGAHSRSASRSLLRSTATSFILGATDHRQLKQVLQHASNSGDWALEELFLILARTAASGTKDEEFIDMALSWWKEHVGPATPTTSKYRFFLGLNQMLSSIRKAGLVPNVPNQLSVLLQSLPLGPSESQLSRELQYYLVEAMSEDGTAVFAFLENWAEKDSAGLTKCIQDDSMQYLLSVMNPRMKSTFMTRCMLADSAGVRKVGHVLFAEDESTVIDQDQCTKATDAQLEILILETIRRPMLGPQTERFYSSLIPVYVARESLCDFFVRHMTEQAINFPGACLEVWSKHVVSDGNYAAVVERANDYFHNLKKTSVLSANGFAFPEFRDAARIGFREFSNRVAKGAKEKSIFLQLVKSVQLLYGRRWATYYDGKIGPVSETKEVSHEIESPRLEEIDPEGMALKRLRAGQRIRSLERG
jgi:hypothetical protein